MKPIKSILILQALLLLANIVTAQVIDPRADIREFLDCGNCEGAQEYYKDALKHGLITNRDYDLEKEIAICLAIKQQEKEYTEMVASCEKRYQEVRSADSVQDMHMRAVYEALLSGDCDMAQQEYLVWYAASGNEDKRIEDHIKQCRKQKAENEKSQAALPLYVDDYKVYKDGVEVNDNEVRALFANTESYDLYDKGKRLVNYDFFNIKGWSLSLGITSMVAGAALQAVFWPLYVGDNKDVEYYYYALNNYNYHEYGSYESLQRNYEECLKKAEREHRIAVSGIWLMGGGAVLMLAENIIEKSIRSSGRTKIRKSVDLYNNGDLRSQDIMEMEYGFTCNGVYFTLFF